MIILRLNDIILYSVMDTGAKRQVIERAFRVSLKRRYYLVQIREYLTLFKNIEGGILQYHSPGGLTKPYVYNGNSSEDPFSEQVEQQASSGAPGGGLTQDQILAIEGMKMQLKSIYSEIVNEFEGLRGKVKGVIEKVQKSVQ
jgi:hypothetical protein